MHLGLDKDITITMGEMGRSTLRTFAAFFSTEKGFNEKKKQFKRNSSFDPPRHLGISSTLHYKGTEGSNIPIFEFSITY